MSALNNTDYLAMCKRALQPAVAEEDLITGEPLEVPAPAPMTTFFESIAMPLAMGRGWQVIPLMPKGKDPHTGLVPSPLAQKSSDPAQIHAWGLAEPNANVGVYAEQREGGLALLDKDGAINLREKYEHETGKAFPKTLLVKSSSLGNGIAKGHWYFLQTPRTIDLTKNIGEAQNGGLFSLRVKNQYVASIGSIHPKTGLPYTIVEDHPVVPMPDDLLDWLLKQVDLHQTLPAGAVGEKPAVNVEVEGAPIPRGQHDNTLRDIARKLRGMGWEQDAIEERLLTVCQQRCVSYGDDWRQMCEKHARNVMKFEPNPVGTKLEFNQTAQAQADASKVRASNELTALQTSAVSDIPAFDEGVVTGVYKQIVDLVTDGTTIPIQFVFLAAKVFIGARMAGKVTFENMDADSSYFGAVIAETGTGKGLAWRRTIENCLMVGESLKASVKIIQSADSGAGLKDAFFDDSGQALTVPVICYVDEATSLGHKAGEKKNPEIVDTIIELADGHRITRVLARNGKKPRVNDDARLSLYMCGQNGEVFMQAFAGRTQLGLYDRLYPEYSPNVEAGDLPHIDAGKAAQVWAELVKLKASGHMKMADGVKSLLDGFWKSQPNEHRNRVRWKKHLMLHMYMSAYGRGSMIAEVQDWEAAKKIYLRQVAIREKHFTTEVPDRLGVYNSRIRVIVERMAARLKAGETVQQVALSQRDFMTATNAYRDNDIHTFNNAWRHWEGALLASVPVTGGNGQKYTKFVPMPNEDEVWKTEG
jgi:hypothetical protein